MCFCLYVSLSLSLLLSVSQQSLTTLALLLAECRVATDVPGSICEDGTEALSRYPPVWTTRMCKDHVGEGHGLQLPVLLAVGQWG